MFPRIDTPGRIHDGELPLLALLLVGGVLLYFPVSPGTYLADVPEIVVPLGTLGGYVVIAYLVRVRLESYSLEQQVGYSGWLGAVLGGIVGLWLASQHLVTGSSFSLVYTEVLRALSIGVGVGTLVGFVAATAQRREPHHDADRGAVVAETTWTESSRANPILKAIVEQLSDLKGANPSDIEPLSTHINLDVFEDIRTGDTSQWQVRFHTAEYEIRVSSAGTITVYDSRQPEKESSTEPIQSAGEHRDVSSTSGDTRERWTATRSSSAQPARTVREAVAAHEQVEPTDLPPLADWIDRATLDALTGSWAELDRAIEFGYVWYSVTVHPNGDVTLRVN